MNHMIETVATAAVGMAVGAAVACAATQDHRKIRHGVHKMTRGAEKALIDLDKLIEHYTG